MCAPFPPPGGFEIRPDPSRRRFLQRLAGAGALGSLAATAGCLMPRAGRELKRRGDEIAVCGRLFHIGTRVVLWTDPSGYDAYRVERRFAPLERAGWEASHAEVPALETPNRYGLRREGLQDEELERVRGGGWDLPLLQRVVDQFVLHYDACGTARRCFEVLHDHRGLSVHFLLDVDGTIYQTLDLKERAWHATTSNSRGIGVEIAHPGAFSPERREEMNAWYPDDGRGPALDLRLTAGATGVRTPGFRAVPAHPEPVTGRIHGQDLVQWDFTREQYEALVRLTAALCRLFPRLRCDYPRDAAGQLHTGVLAPQELRDYRGLIGHYHIQQGKVDPGPAMDWDRVVQGAARRLPRSLRQGAGGGR